MRLFYLQWICVFSWIGLSAAAPCQGAEPNAPQTMAEELTDIEILVTQGVEHNPELGFYVADVAAAKGERLQAGRWPNLEVTTSFGQQRVRGPGLAVESEAWAVSVRQTIGWPGRIALRKAIANHDVELAELGLAQFKSALAARTRTLAYVLFAAQQKGVASQEVAERFQQLREVVVQRNPAGLTPLLETAKLRPESVEEFREAAALADRHYRLAAVPIATYMELQKQYLEAVQVLLETRREALEASHVFQQITGLQLQAPLDVKSSEKFALIRP